jgi:hypothetical protein
MYNGVPTLLYLHKRVTHAAHFCYRLMFVGR